MPTRSGSPSPRWRRWSTRSRRRTPTSAGHSARVADLSASVAAQLGCDDELIEAIRTGGRLHDIGKIGIREEILNKQGPLSDEEYEHVKQHVLVGSQILAPLVHLKEVITYVRSHHERWDGFGYPDRLAGEAIPLGARIIGAVEIYDALTTARPYQEKMVPDVAVERMARPRGHRARSRRCTRRCRPWSPSARRSSSSTTWQDDRGDYRPHRAGTSRKVLLVDDDPVMVRLVRKILADNGFRSVVHAATGREALDQLEGVDVVLLDHQLPDTTGLEVLEAIRTRPQPPAVILVTAHGNESLAATALRRGADDYLAKDLSLAELLPQVLERVRRTRELRKALGAAERDLVRAERLAAIGEMTVTLHHEINNPLMAAFAHVELLLADPAMTAESRQETLTSVRDALHRIRDIMRRDRRSPRRSAPRATPPASRWWISPTSVRHPWCGAGWRSCS